MKNIILTLIIALCLTAATRAQTDALPTLRGADAVNKLKETGTYDSLIDAVKVARQEDDQTESLGAEAVGQTAKLTASDPVAEAAFGYSIAFNGDTAIVGAPGDPIGVNQRQGSAYVFVLSGTVWTVQQKLTVPDGAAFDRFGASVAIWGNTVIVGAALADVGANPNQGAAYIFTRADGVWTQRQKLVASDGSLYREFGTSVAISGDTAMVGFVYGVYVFNFSGAAWTERQKIFAPAGVTGSFADSVRISGDTAIIGAQADDAGGIRDRGSAFIFVRSGTMWIEQQKLTASDGGSDDFFGHSVAISGDTAIVGAYLDDVGATVNQGSAYIFTRSGTTWTEQRKLTASDGGRDDEFGNSVAISGDLAIVGAHHAIIKGSAYIFARSGGRWSESQKLTSSDGESGSNDDFGSSVTILDRTALVGASFAKSGETRNAGAAYVFPSLDEDWRQEEKTTAGSNQNYNNFGYSIAVSGDTAVVGAPTERVSNRFDAGAAYVFVRSGAAWSRQARLFASDLRVTDYFGYSVAISGDTIVVGNNEQEPTGLTNYRFGSAYVFVRVGTTWTQQAKLRADDGAADDRFGATVAISGETILVGAERDDVGAKTDQGSAYIFTRSDTQWTQQAHLTAFDGAISDHFGTSVSIDADTAVIGAANDKIGTNSNQGSTYVFVKNGAVWTEQQKLTAADGAYSDFFGYSVAISGNTVVVGAVYDDVGANLDQGSAYVFVRSGTTWTQQAQFTGADGAASDYFGNTVAISGEIVVVGATGDDVGANNRQGSAYIFERRSGIWMQKQQLFDNTGGENAYFGVGAAVSGDKIIVGAPLDHSIGAAVFFINATSEPLPEYVSVGGRVTTNTGKGLANAVVTLTDIYGVSRTTRTTRDGYYLFSYLTTGDNFVVSAKSKRYVFTSFVVTVNEQVTGLNFVAEP